MASRIISIGDVLMLSQQAWNIGRAFAQDRGNAPTEFSQAGHEANALSEALKRAAEVLHADSSLESSPDPRLSNAVTIIFQSVGSTLSDLEAYVDSYQVIRKREIQRGFLVERTWAEDVVASYKTISWTTSGANTSDVQNLLRLHAEAIDSTIHALQSRSADTLERVVLLAVEVVANIQTVEGDDLGARIDELRRRIRLIVSEASWEEMPPPVSAEGQTTPGPEKDVMSASKDDIDRLAELQITNTMSSRSPSLLQLKKAEALPHDSAHSTPALPTWRESDFVASSSNRDKVSLAEGGRFISNSSLLRRESTTLPRHPGGVDTTVDDIGSLAEHYRRVVGKKVSLDSRDTFLELGNESILPPPLLPATSSGEQPQTPSTPVSFSKHVFQSHGDPSNALQRSSHETAGSGRKAVPSAALVTLPAFERLLFRNAAILCDVGGKSVEYARKVPDEPDPRYDTEMTEACKECRICVIRKRENRPNGGTKVATSIWAIAKDGAVRCQQKLSDSVETVPYCSYFEHEKVSIPPTEGQITLEFHGEIWGEKLEQQLQTSWVNYFLSGEDDAIAFQSAVYGRMLMGSFRTTKTTVIHDGLLGTFAFEEQFANIEMLRLFQDDGLATPGAQGGVLALMHISSNFGEGWARWWMNCSRQQVRIKADGPRHARLKGIDISVVKPGQMVSMGDKLRNKTMRGELQKMDTETLAKWAGKPVPVKRVTGIRVEFKEEEERDRFLDMSRRVQSRLITLPALGGS